MSDMGSAVTRQEENINFRYIPRRGYWAAFEFVSTFAHLVLGLPTAAVVCTLSFARQFFRLLRLDMPTYKGQTRGGDPGQLPIVHDDGPVLFPSNLKQHSG
eukprot:1861070-Rhodomonas_salina.2